MSAQRRALRIIYRLYEVHRELNALCEEIEGFYGTGADASLIDEGCPFPVSIDEFAAEVATWAGQIKERVK